MNQRLGFVILHYNAIKETIDCIESIEKRIDTDNYHIVVVDNCSPNRSGEDLKNKYKDSQKITVICAEENLGFARGNNIGYKYAKDVLKCEFICIMNNDTLIIQDDFYKVIRDEYNESKFGVLGPRIILKNDRDNGIYIKLPSKEFLEEELHIQKRDLFLMTWHLDHFVTAYKLTRNYINKLRKKKPVSRYGEFFKLEGTKQRHDSLVLHGCCLVFSPAYMREYEDAFNPDTFLYREEEILHLRCKKKKLPIIYNPMLKIKHLEDASTDTIVRGNRDKIMFQMRNQIDSIKVLLKEINDIK